MPPPPTDLEPSATYARPTNANDPSIPSYLAACKTNNVPLVTQLVRNFERRDGSLTFGLNNAVTAGHHDVVRALLAMGVKWDAETVNKASASLHTLQLLVEFGFEVNDPLPEGCVLLRAVVAHNDEATIRWLLEQGADPNLGAPLNSQETIPWRIRPVQDSGAALNACARSSSPDIFQLLLSHGAKLENAVPLHMAAGVGPEVPPGGRIPMMKYLVGLGIDVNSMDDAMKQGEHGQGQWGTPLQYAIVWHRIEEAKWLLQHGADVDKLLPGGFTTRQYIQRRQPEMGSLISAHSQQS
ncbi:ankyrin repeat-containing domain protein [Lophiotrema nucula]|uniref:Ankyrin repeat-containing domain protein n=1 Tax=Lophiotrema nucula TaxID=690887 RepID=A0A6A5ZHZ7_9PLEO|nr:ankyrin repeat-containing domain protein [Lophiotrema nucula]